MPSEEAERASDNVRVAIEKAKRELEHMMDLNPQIMLLVNNEGAVVRTNRCLLDFLGLESFRDALNVSLKDLFDCDDPNFIPDLLSKIGAAPAEAVTRLPDGRQRTLLYRVIASGRDTELRMLIIEDITKEKANSVHLEKEHKKKAVEALMGALMHNINQPLTVIMVTARLMHLALEKGTCDQDEMKKNLQDIMDLTMKIAKLLDQVSDARDYVTETYLDGIDILDIQRSAAGAE